MNLEYTLYNGLKVKFLDDTDIYLGIEILYDFDSDLVKCFGIKIGEKFLFVNRYGSEAGIIILKRR